MSLTAHPLSIRIAAWISGRQGVEHEAITLDRKRVYVLPTRAGLAFAAVLLVMLIGSMNYGLQLGYLLTFTIASMAVVGMYHTHRNLSRLQLQGLRGSDAFAGDLVGFTVMAVNPTAESRYALSFSLLVGRRRQGDFENGVVRPLPGANVDLSAHGQHEINLALPTRRRGRRPCPRIRIETHFPFGLWTAWAYFTPSLEAIVYPKPEDDAPPLPMGQGGTVESASAVQGGDDLAGVRPYQSGDPQKRIAWRLAARSDDLSVRVFDSPSGGELMLDWNALAHVTDAEQRLSRLTRWVLNADANHMRYGLTLPGFTLDLDSGTEHRQRCLRALALAEV